MISSDAQQLLMTFARNLCDAVIGFRPEQGIFPSHLDQIQLYHSDVVARIEATPQLTRRTSSRQCYNGNQTTIT